jgi:hypothetical protein
MNYSDTDDNAYELFALAYNREMDQLMLMNNIANIKEKESRFPTYLGKGMIEMDDEEETTPTTTKCTRDKMMDTSEEEQTTPHATPRLAIGSNNVNMTFPKIGLENNSTTPLKFIAIEI